jgi:hypothetical protein
MQYQLPSGKVIYLSTEEFLSMSDQELHDLTNCGGGDEPSSAMYYGKRTSKPKPVEEKPIPLDYDPNKDETFGVEPEIDPNTLPDS